MKVVNMLKNMSIRMVKGVELDKLQGGFHSNCSNNNLLVVFYLNEI